jgi:transposase InsO family protein
MKGEHSIRGLCELLEVSPSGYYKWLHARPSARQREDAELAVKIAATHRQSRGNYGSPRIVAELRDQGTKTSRRRCARLMHDQDLCGRKRHSRKPRTTDSRHDRPVAKNRLAQSPAPTKANQIWITDITYLRTSEGWLFLAAILDAWSRRVVGWACAPTLHASLVLATLHRAIRNRCPEPGLLHHSDRGSQYVDADYLQALAATGIERSMSRAGNCYDNAAMESFWSTLKTESELEDGPLLTRRQTELAVFDYIETFYNPVRRHSSLGYFSPVAFEKQQNLNNIKVA